MSDDMGRYAALLRGIAPSNPNMTNDKLRDVLTGLGLESVGSVLASGNLVFRADAPDMPALENRIQRGLNAELGIPGGVIAREHGELRGLLDRDPFDGLTHGRGTYLTVTFLKDRLASVPVPEPADPRTRVVGYDRAAAAFLAIIDNSEPGRTPDFMAWLDRTYGKDITTRTWRTVLNIAKKLG